MTDALPTLKRWEAIGTILVLTMGITALAGVLDIEIASALTAIVGFVILLPLTAILGDRLPYVASSDDDATDSSTATDDAIDRSSVLDGSTSDVTDESDHAVARLRERYARGEIDEVEFERKLERLLETEALDGTVGTGLDGTVGTGLDGTVETGLDGTVGTGLDGTVETGLDRVTEPE